MAAQAGEGDAAEASSSSGPPSASQSPASPADAAAAASARAAGGSPAAGGAGSATATLAGAVAAGPQLHILPPQTENGDGVSQSLNGDGTGVPEAEFAVPQAAGSGLRALPEAGAGEGIQGLGDDLLTAVLQRALAQPREPRALFAPALVCRRWHAAHLGAQQHLELRPLVRLRPWGASFPLRSEAAACREIAQFPALTSLTLHQGAVDTLSPAFFASLCQLCPRLEALSFGDQPWYLTDASPICAGVTCVAENLTQLSSLALPRVADLDDFEVPASLARLAGSLTALDLGTAGIQPGTLAALRSLQRLSLSKLPEPLLQDLVLAMRSLPRLAELNVYKAGEKEPSASFRLPDSLWDLSSLASLSLAAGARPWPVEWSDRMSLLTNLQSLSLSTFTTRGLSLSLGRLTALRRLRLDCALAQELPHSLGALVRLQDLFLKGFCIKALPPGLGRLTALKNLTIKCASLASVPADLARIRGLESVELEVGAGALQELRWGCMRALQRLTLFTEDEHLDPALVTLPALTSLDLALCPLLASLPSDFAKLTALKDLSLGGAPLLAELPASLGYLDRLTSLSAASCKIRKLPGSFQHLWALESLRLDDLPALVELPRGLGQLARLRRLQLRELRALPRIPEALGEMARLEDLEVHKCVLLRGLPESLGRAARLRRLAVSACPKLRALPESLGALESLERLELELLERLPELPGSLGGLASLATMSLNGCERLDALPVSLGSLKKIHDLELAYVPIRSLPDSFGQLGALRTLEMWSLGSLVELPESFGQLASLRRLHVCFCPLLRSLPRSLGRLPSLEALKLLSCDDLRALPSTLGGLSSLTSLDLQGLTSLGALPESMGQLRALQRLRLVDLPLVRKLPGSVAQLGQLAELEIEQCKSLRQVPVEALASLPLLGAASLQRLLQHLPDKEAPASSKWFGCF